jgi:hypothetical protein
MYWSGCQSTGAEMRKYLTVPGLAPLLYTDTGQPGARCQVHAHWHRQANNTTDGYIRLSTCCSATMLSGGRLCCASWSRRKVSGATERAWGGAICELGNMLRCNTSLCGRVFGLWRREGQTSVTLWGAGCSRSRNARGKRGEGPARLGQQWVKRKAKEKSASDGLRYVK